MIPSLYKRWFPVLLCLLFALLVAGKALYPGYLILLDLPWAPTFPLTWSMNAFNNSYLVYAGIHLLTLFISSWIVQKLYFVGMLFLLFYIPWRYMPYIKNNYARAFAVGVFALNPFVYGRILSGQWFQVIGYALLPFLLYALVQVTNTPTKKSIARLVAVLLLISLFSIHFLYLALIITFVWITKHAFYSWWGSRKLKNQTHVKRLLMAWLYSFIFFAVFSSYWLVPALLRTQPLESRFDNAHFMAFAASANGNVSVLENVAALGGFWAEGMAWRYFFIFPQESPFFWAAFIVIFLFVLLGIRTRLKNKATRYSAIILVALGIFAYITALGEAITPFRIFNMFLYQHVPFWDGLRDSHKIVGVLALLYSLLSGLGVEALIAKLKIMVLKGKSEKVKVDPNSVPNFLLWTFSCALLVIPMVYGMYMWGGLHNQLQPVYYPHEWKELKAELDQMPKGERILVLPWHSYLSLPFVNNRLVANPMESYFGKDRVIVGRDVGVGAVHDQEVDVEYRTIDNLITHAYMLEPQVLVDTLEGYGIYGVIIIRNPLITHADDGVTAWTQFSDEDGTPIVEDIANVVATSSKTWAQMLPKKTTKKAIGQSLFLLTF